MNPLDIRRALSGVRDGTRALLELAAAIDRNTEALNRANELTEETLT